MSLAPQVTEATGPSSLTIIEQGPDQWGREQALVEGPYGRSTFEVGREHDNCQYQGVMLGDRAEWANIYYCSGCNYSIYYPLGD